jgi:hypothetical protein
MATPKGYRTNININPSKIGVPHRRQEILDGLLKNTKQFGRRYGPNTIRFY